MAAAEPTGAKGGRPLAYGLPYADLEDARISRDLRKRVAELEKLDRERRESAPKDYPRAAISHSLNPRTNLPPADEQWFSRKDTYVAFVPGADAITAAGGAIRKELQ